MQQKYKALLNIIKQKLTFVGIFKKNLLRVSSIPGLVTFIGTLDQFFIEKIFDHKVLKAMFKNLRRFFHNF